MTFHFHLTPEFFSVDFFDSVDLLTTTFYSQ